MRFLSAPIAGILMAILLLAGLTSPGQAELSSADKKQVETLIENFIRENPVLLRDVLTRLAEAEAEAAQQAAMGLVYDDSGDPYIGAEQPELIIYEFSDYNCGYCKRVFPDLIASGHKGISYSGRKFSSGRQSGYCCTGAEKISRLS
ncbi:MAG: hypothetical protein EBR12_04745 [Proteobacteria bacterium]|nr:hypothetical protein [Pseudomonadota bacterium]